MLCVSQTGISVGIRMLLKQNYKMATVRTLPGVEDPGDERMRKGATWLTAHAWGLISARRDMKYSSFERSGDGMFVSRGKPYHFHMHFFHCPSDSSFKQYSKPELSRTISHAVFLRSRTLLLLLVLISRGPFQTGTKDGENPVTMFHLEIFDIQF